MKHGNLIRSFALTGILASSCLLAHVFSFAAAPQAKAAEAVVAEEATVSTDYSQETYLDDDRILFGVNSSTTTGISQSLGLSVSSQVITYKNRPQDGNIFVKINDPTFVSESESKVPTDEEGNPLGDLPIYEGEVYCIKGTKQKRSKDVDVVIPKYLTLQGYFIIHVSGIVSDVCADSSSTADDKWKNIANIYIHDEIETIAEDAFKGIPETIGIKCLGEEKEGWDDKWTDSTNVEYNVEAPESVTSILEQSSTGSYAFGSGENFMVGFHEEGEYYRPLTMTYNILDENDNLVTTDAEYVIPLNSTSRLFDAVGSSVGSISISFSVDIPIEKGLHIDLGSLLFHNVFEAVKVDGKWLPDLTIPYCAIPSVSAQTVFNIDEFVSMNIKTISTFMGYTEFGVDVDVKPGIFEKANPTSYIQNRENIEKGIYYVNYSFVALNLARYRVTYRVNNELKEEVIRVNAPANYDFVTLDKKTGNILGLSFENSAVGEGFSIQTVEKIELIGFNIRLVLRTINSSNKESTINKSKVDTRFGAVVLYDKSVNTGVKPVDIGIILIIIAGVYVAIYAAAAVGYYVYSKNRYKNDEFRRVNNKKFLISSLKNGAGFGLVVMSISFIIFRWGLMNNTVVSFNPLDVFVIIFTVAAAIFLGLFIKDVVISVRNNMKRKRNRKLKLDQDIVDDGTH
ncbi:MAG: hypothetical protein K5694_01290 [Bacilli bacterium]|nr:hypothetical protein [Bacilli bacterium]